jgi:predicted GNAT family acetyltransferase
MATGKITIRDNPDEHRVELRVDDEIAGVAEYVLGPGTIVITHTLVEEKWPGRGLGTRLSRHVLDYARERGLRVRPKCPFIRSYIERHPNYGDLVAART